MNTPLTIAVLPGELTVCRLAPDAVIPDWAFHGDVQCVTRTAYELSIICGSNAVPADVKSERGWRAFKVEGPLDFSLVGILASLATALAEAQISIFAVSTFDTDYILVRSADLEAARAALSEAGHHLVGP